MKKIIRLTESDLMRIVKRVINEQQLSSSQSSDKTSLANFLRKFDCGVIDTRFVHWEQNPKNE